MRFLFVVSLWCLALSCYDIRFSVYGFSPYNYIGHIKKRSFKYQHSTGSYDSISSRSARTTSSIQSSRSNVIDCLTSDSIHLRIIHFNDVYKLDHLPKLKGLVDQLRQEQHNKITMIPNTARTTICTLGGDFFSPSLLSSIDKGASMTSCLSQFVDFACLGNHEADVSLMAFSANIDLFNGTIINSNFPIILTSKKKLPTEYTIELNNPGRDHVRTIRLLGLLDNSPSLYLPNAFGEGAVEAAEHVMDCCQRHLFDSGDNTIILPLTHQYIDDDIKLAKLLGCPSRMPLILGGHDHEPYDVRVSSMETDDADTDNNPIDSITKCRVLKAGMDAEAAIVIDMVWPSNQSTIPEIDVDFIPIIPSAALPSSDVEIEECTFSSCPELEELVHRYQEPLMRLDRTVLKVLERRDQALSSVGVRQRQTTIGSLICTALRKGLHSDVAILNGGSIRGNTVYTLQASFNDDTVSESDQTSGKGQVKNNTFARTGKDFWRQQKSNRFFTYADLLRELPYETEICVVHMPGYILEQTIDWSRNPDTYGCSSAAYLQTCNKLEVMTSAKANDKKSNSDRVPWKITRIRGEPFDPTRIYKVAIQHHLLTGMDNIRPLVQYFENGDGSLPPFDATRPAKELVLQVYHKEIWLSLPPFDEIDTADSDYISRQELSVALAKSMEIEPTDKLIDDTINAFDVNGDGHVSRHEYESCLSMIRKNRFDLNPQDCVEEYNLLLQQENQ